MYSPVAFILLPEDFKSG